MRAEFGADFKTLLKLNNITQKEFAEMVGLSPQTIGKWDIAPPKWATGYLQLMLDKKASAENLGKANSVIADYVDSKMRLRSLVKKAEEMVEIIGESKASIKQRRGAPPPKKVPPPLPPKLKPFRVAENQIHPEIDAEIQTPKPAEKT